MKKFILLLSLFAVISLGHSSNVVPVEDAIKVSKNFLSERIGSLEAQKMSIQLVYTEVAADGTPVFYRFQVNDNGFIVISATELGAPVLAYSLESNYKAGTGADIYYQQYKAELSNLIANPSLAKASDKSAWNYYLNDNFKISAKKSAPYVEPLVTTTWTQETYYNQYCPVSSDPQESMDYRTPVGCVALTMSNIMYYYRYPETGHGSVYYIPKEYNDDRELVFTYPPQSVNFGKTHYNYDAMANVLNDYSGETAKLSHHAGVSVRMSYGNDGSGSNSSKAIEALQDHFNYSVTARHEAMKETVVADSLLYKWEDKLMQELDMHHPLFFDGSSKKAGGHAWIVDGYTTIDNVPYFHVNWGWAGSGNGFFRINNQNTAQYGNFNNEQSESAFLGMIPGDSAAVVKPVEGEKRITASFGSVSDGAGHMKYQPNTNRKWVLACPNATSYTISFDKIKIKEGDELIIYNGGTESAGIKETYSGDYLMAACQNYTNISGCVHGDYEGKNLPSAITIQKDSVLIVFKSNADEETDYGFVLSFKVNSFSGEDKCSRTCIVKDDWHKILTDKANNEINDNKYLPQTFCQWNLQVPYTTGYTFVFPKFDLKAGDFVEFYDVTKAPVFLARYDIYNMPTDVFTLNSSKIRVKFNTDNWEEGTGFQLEYYQIASINDNPYLSEVNIYPNPASTNVNIAIASDKAQNINAKVVDMTGKVVYMNEFNHNGGEQTYQIPVNNMAKGIYFLHLQSDCGKNIQKFIVQ